MSFNVNLSSTSGLTTIGATTPLSVSSAGVLTINNTTASTTTTSGALIVSGGAGIAGSLYTGLIVNPTFQNTGTANTGTAIGTFKNPAGSDRIFIIDETTTGSVSPGVRTTSGFGLGLFSGGSGPINFYTTGSNTLRMSISNAGALTVSGAATFSAGLTSTAATTTLGTSTIGAITGTSATFSTTLGVTGLSTLSGNVITPVITGSTASGGTLTLRSTTNATKGSVFLDEDNGVFIVDASPEKRLGIVKKSGGGPFFATGSGASFDFRSSSTTTIDNVAATSYTSRFTISAAGVVNIPGLTASQAVFTDGSDNLVSVAVNGTGNVVLTTSPTLVTPVLGVASATRLSLSSSMSLTNSTGSILMNTRINSIGCMVNSTSAGNSITTDLKVMNKRIKTSNYNGIRCVSTWYSRSGIDASKNWQSVCWSNELSIFVAVNSNGVSPAVQYSSDGINWTNSVSTGTARWQSVCWAPEQQRFIAVATDANSSGAVAMYSTNINDPTSWTNTNSLNTANTWFDVCWSNELELAVAVGYTGSNAAIATSINGITWVDRVPPVSDIILSAICWAPELLLFAAVSLNGYIMTSSNGVTWTLVTPPVLLDTRSITWSSELYLFVTANTGTTILTSPDGITWTTRTVPDGQWISVVWSPELSVFAMISSLALVTPIISSPDGITWTTRTNSTVSQWNHITWSPELSIFLAVGSDSGSARSITSTPGLPNSRSTLLVNPNHISVNAGTGLTTLSGGLISTAGTTDLGTTTAGTITTTGKVSIGGTDPLTIGRLFITGTNNNVANGPHLNAFTATDNFPVYHQLNFSHDNILMGYDMYYDGAFKRSHSSTGYGIYKLTGELLFQYTSGAGVGGDLATRITGMKMGNTGLITLGSSTPVTVSAAGILTVGGAATFSSGLTSTAATTALGTTTTGTITTTGKVSIGGTDPLTIGRLFITGTNANVPNGPHSSFYTASDNFPLFQQLNWTHDDISLSFDIYYNGTWRRGSTTASYQIYKRTGELSFLYVSAGGTAGDDINASRITGMKMNGSGLITLGSSTPVTVSSAGILTVGGAATFSAGLTSTAGTTALGTTTASTVTTTGNVSVGGDLIVGSSSSVNAIRFNGVTSDPGTSSTFIVERLYDKTSNTTPASDISELLLAKFNDIEGATGPDRIRLIAGTHVFSTYASAIGSPAITTTLLDDTATMIPRMTIASTGVISLGTSNSMTVSAAGAVVVNGSTTFNALTASLPVALNASKVLITSPITGTGTTIVMQSGPTIIDSLLQGSGSIQTGATMAKFRDSLGADRISIIDETISTSLPTGIVSSTGLGLGMYSTGTGSINFYTTSGNTLRMSIANGGAVNVVGALSKGSGTFDIPHPDPEKEKQGYRLRHSFVESNTRGDNLYRYTVSTVNCKAEIELPDYFNYLNENPQVFISAQNVLGYGKGNVENSKVFIETSADGIYNVLVIGTRKDKVAVENFDGTYGPGMEYIKQDDI